MKAAAVNPHTRSTSVVEIEEPKITTPNGVKLRILRVGVCGTDREICAFEYGDPPAGSDFLVLGHETIGEVVEVGSAVSSLQPGDLAVPMVRRPCHHPECVACQAGRQDFCYTGDYTERGIKQRHGFMTELIVDEEVYMTRMPPELREIGVLTEPLTIAEKALEQILAVQKRLPWGNPGDSLGYNHRALVLGAGPVGLLGAMALKNAGFDVAVYSKNPAPNVPADIVAQIGARYISSMETPVEKLSSKTGNIDVVYEAVGASQFAFDVLKVLGVNGLFVLTGVPGIHAPVKVDTDTIMRNMVLKNQALIGSVNAGRQAFESAVKDLGDFNRKWPAAVRALITAQFPLDSFEDPIHSHKGIKNVIEIAK
jgi:threonine dehydrogenase-like Zn-dependent dehydrogenase